MRILSIDVGGHFIKTGIVEDKKMIHFRKYKTNRNYVIQDLKKIIRKHERKIKGVSVGIPGLVQKGMVYYPPNFPNIKELNLKKELKRYFKFEILIENDANLYTLGEAWEGTGKGYKNIVVMTLGTGVGGGIIIDGRLYRGSSGFAGEVGHIIIEKDGRLCNCGMKGCLEAYIGAERIVKDYVEMTGDNKVNDVIEIGNLARKGNQKARRILNETGKNLGVGISSLFNVLSPDLFVIGGGISNLWDIIEKPMKTEIRKRIKRKIIVKKGVLGDNAGIIGGYILFEQYAGDKIT